MEQKRIEEKKMTQTEIRKKIADLEKPYLDAAEKVNRKSGIVRRNILKQIEGWRMSCVEDIFKIMHKNPELKRLEEQWSENYKKRKKQEKKDQ